MNDKNKCIWKMLWNGNECRKKTKVMRISRQLFSVKIIIDLKQLENVVFLDGRCTCEIKSRIAMAKAAFSTLYEK
jgi:hypothetical protein